MSSFLPPELRTVRRLNRGLERAWTSGFLPRPRLDSLSLARAALRGRSDDCLGPVEAWREPLEQLTEALAREADLNPIGQAMAHGQIVMALRTRINERDLFRRNPGIIDKPLAPPIIIIGQMRSGTTRLQRLLACDPRLSHTRLYEALLPVPRFGRSLKVSAMMAFLHRLNPELHRIHPTRSNEPDEEFGLFSPSIGSAQFEAQWRVPSFSRWWEERKVNGLYREFVQRLQMIGWSGRVPDDRRRVIKAPQFMQDLETVLKVFPQASLLRIERDLAEIVASSASLIWNQMRVQSDSADPEWIGREWLRKTRLRERAAKMALNDPKSPPVFPISFAAMNRDWRAEMKRVYQHIGLSLTAPVERRMALYLKGARSHHGHRYSLEQFGLSSSQVASLLDPL